MLQCAGQMRHVIAKPFIPEHHGVEPGQTIDAVGQAFSRRHFGIADQDRNHPLVLLQGGFDLDPHVILGMVDATAAAVVACVDPVRADHREQDRALGHPILDYFDKVLARLDAVDVEEQTVGIESLVQRVKQSSRTAGIVASPIADENLPWHERYSRRGWSALS